MTDLHDPMTMTDLDELEAAVTPSLLDKLRQQRANAKAKTLDLRIPLFGVADDESPIQVVARMRRIPLGGRNAVAHARVVRRIIADDTTSDDLNPECDLLIAGLEQLYAREGEEGSLEPLDADHPMRFDQHLAEAFGREAKTAREVVRDAFGGPEGGFNLRSAAQAYAVWLQGGVNVAEAEGKA